MQKKNMKARSVAAVSAFALAGALVVSGCAFRPESMPMTSRDNEIYNDPGAPKALATKENRAKVAVVTSAGAYPAYKMVAESLQSTLTANLSEFAFFEVVDRSSAAALAREKIAASDDPSELDLKQVEADFLVIAKIASVTATQLKVDVQFDFKWLSIESQKVIMTKSIRPPVRMVAGADELPSALVRASEVAAREFNAMVAAKYAPPARVLQTRGGGRAARISLGKNYGLTEGTEVCFFEIIDNSAVGGEKRDVNDIARGIVKSVEATSAWVEVADFEKVSVRRGVYVRALEKKKTFGSNFLEQTGLNETLGN